MSVYEVLFALAYLVGCIWLLVILSAVAWWAENSQRHEREVEDD